MHIWSAALLYKANLQLGEGAFWHRHWQKFLFVDIEGKKVGAIDHVTRNVILHQLPQMVSTVIPAGQSHLLIALEHSLALLDFNTGTMQHVAYIEKDKEENRCNEGKCDAAGRLWIGTMHKSAKKGEGALYCYDGALQKKLDGISISNGICWNKENTIMYYIDSFAYNIRAFGFDVTTGDLTSEAVVIEVKEPDLVPDGMCIDEEGMLWVAMWGGGCVHRYNPSNGALIGRVEVPAPQVTTCAFGGTNMQQLLISTAATGLTEQELQQYPLSGSLFIADTGIRGMSMHHFNTSALSEYK